MKRTLPLVALAALAILGLSIPGFTNSGASPSGRSGGPANGGQTCASSGCHSGGPAIGAQTITITSDIPSTGFEENTDYTITVEANTNGDQGSRIGFIASVESASGSHEGAISSADSRTQNSGASYITHTSSSLTPSSGINSWDFNWNSGTADDGATVYAAVNFSNGNGTTTGDAIGTATLVLTKAPGVGLDENRLAEFSLYPSPATDYTTVEFSLSGAENVSYQIISTDGKVVASEELGLLNAGKNQVELPLTSIDAGTYILHIQSETKTTAERFTKL